MVLVFRVFGFRVLGVRVVLGLGFFGVRVWGFGGFGGLGRG